MARRPRIAACTTAGRSDAGDQAAIHEVHASAFPTAAEARLVDALRAAGQLAISIVASDADGVVGHIAFSPVVAGGNRARAGGLASADSPMRRRSTARREVSACAAAYRLDVVSAMRAYYARRSRRASAGPGDESWARAATTARSGSSCGLAAARSALRQVEHGRQRAGSCAPASLPGSSRACRELRSDRPTRVCAGSSRELWDSTASSDRRRRAPRDRATRRSVAACDRPAASRDRRARRHRAGFGCARARRAPGAGRDRSRPRRSRSRSGRAARGRYCPAARRARRRARRRTGPRAPRSRHRRSPARTRHRERRASRQRSRDGRERGRNRECAHRGKPARPMRARLTHASWPRARRRASCRAARPACAARLFRTMSV